MALDSEIKFRCEAELVARFERIAVLERRKTSDLARLVFEDYVAALESKLGITNPRVSFGKSNSGKQSDAGTVLGAADKKDRRGRKS